MMTLVESQRVKVMLKMVKILNGHYYFWTLNNLKMVNLLSNDLTEWTRERKKARETEKEREDGRNFRWLNKMMELIGTGIHNALFHTIDVYDRN